MRDGRTRFGEDPSTGRPIAPLVDAETGSSELCRTSTVAIIFLDPPRWTLPLIILRPQVQPPPNSSSIYAVRLRTSLTPRTIPRGRGDTKRAPET